jgi:hypothetical protein
MQTSLNQRVIKQAIVFSARDKGKASHIGEDRSIAILPIEPEHCAFWWDLMGRQIPANGGDHLAQFLPIAPVPSVPETAEPTFNCAPATPLFSCLSTSPRLRPR